MKKQDKQSNIRFLVIVLLVSLAALTGIYGYARNWESISAINWLERGKRLVERIGEQKQQLLGASERTMEYKQVVQMLHTLPVLSATAEGTEVLAVPLLSQDDSGYQTGCELVSGAMLLQYYGLEASPEQVYEAIDRVDSPVDGQKNGYSPHDYFIGNPQRADGYGCYAEPLLTAMNRLLDGGQWHAVNISGTSMETIESAYLNQGTPVIIWATIHMAEPQQGNTWTLQDGTLFQWKSGEHCLVLVGADENYYYFNDPNCEGEVVGYERSVVEERYEQLGMQAIILSR